MEAATSTVLSILIMGVVSIMTAVALTLTGHDPAWAAIVFIASIMPVSIAINTLASARPQPELQ